MLYVLLTRAGLLISCVLIGLLPGTAGALPKAEYFNCSNGNSYCTLAADAATLALTEDYFRNGSSDLLATLQKMMVKIDNADPAYGSWTANGTLILNPAPNCEISTERIQLSRESLESAVLVLSLLRNARATGRCSGEPVTRSLLENSVDKATINLGLLYNGGSPAPYPVSANGILGAYTIPACQGLGGVIDWDQTAGTNITHEEILSYICDASAYATLNVPSSVTLTGTKGGTAVLYLSLVGNEIAGDGRSTKLVLSGGAISAADVYRGSIPITVDYP